MKSDYTISGTVNDGAPVRWAGLSVMDIYLAEHDEPITFLDANDTPELGTAVEIVCRPMVDGTRIAVTVIGGKQ